jgi:hypothetical protein
MGRRPALLLSGASLFVDGRDLQAFDRDREPEVILELRQLLVAGSGNYVAGRISERRGGL